MVRTAVAAGFEVVVATRLREHGARIEAEGCRVVALENERSSLGSPEMFRGFARIWRILRDEKPDVVPLHFAAHGRARRHRGAAAGL
jgi:hypothetical protein